MTKINTSIEKSKNRLYNMPKFKSVKLLSKFLLTLLLVVTLTFTGLQSIKAEAAAVSVAIGETRTYKITYNNAQGESGANPMLLKIYIGDKLNVDTSSFVDTFDPSGTTPTPFCINPAFIAVDSEPGWGYYLQYAPRSSSTAVPSNNTCTTGGLSTANPTDIPAGKVGEITFKATLKNTATAGQVLDPATAVAGKYQGVRAKILTTVATTVFTSPDADLTINVTAAATTEVNPDTGGNIGNLTSCTPAATAIVISNTYSCDFPITGAGPFALPTGGISARTNQGTNNSTAVSSCAIVGAASPYILRCTLIKTDNASFTPAAAKVQLAKGAIVAGSTWNDKGALTLIAATTEVNPDTGGNIGNLTSCTPAATAIVISNTYSCDFPITGAGPFALPTGGISARTNQGTNNSTAVSSCAIVGAASPYILRCTLIKTDNASFTPAAAKVQLAKGAIVAGSTWNDKGALTLIAPAGIGARFAILFTPDAKTAPYFNASFGQIVVSGKNLAVTDDATLTSAYTCKIEAKLFEVDGAATAWLTLGNNITYNNSTGCSANFTEANRTSLGYNLNYRFKITITRSSDSLVVLNSSTLPLQIGGGGTAN